MNKVAYPEPAMHAETIRGDWLIKMSVILAIAFEVVPAERNIIGVLLSLYNIHIVLLLLIKAFCVVLIILPLVIYTVFNGVRGLMHVRGRALFVGVVVVINLAVDLFLLWIFQMHHT
jgi:hypothetical protein